MTREQTRQLAIEFERRIIEIYPSFANEEKLDTDTIYSFLSEYVLKYVDGLILAKDKLENGTGPAIKAVEMLKSLIRHKNLRTSSISDLDSMDICTTIQKPSDYYRYIRSTSSMPYNYKNPRTSGIIKSSTNTAPNQLIKQEDVASIMTSYVNSGNILRYPFVVFESTINNDSCIKIIHDNYTVIKSVDLVYYAYPYRFNLQNYDDEDMSEGAIHSTCSLPFSAFNDVVDGAVQMYISQYKFLLLGGNKKQPQQQKQQEQTEQ